MKNKKFRELIKQDEDSTREALAAGVVMLPVLGVLIIEMLKFIL